MTLLEDITVQMNTRLDELRPSVEEFEQLDLALTKLNGVGVAAAPDPFKHTAKQPAKPTVKKRRRRRGRPKGVGQTRTRILQVVQKRPGMTLPEVASSVGIRPNYLYRALPAMEKQGQVVQRTADKTWWPS